MASLFERIEKGKKKAPRRTLLYGVHGIGKSTFAAQAEKAIFIPTEEGLNDLDCESFPIAGSYQQVIDSMMELCQESHDYKTVVIDSLDWLEHLIWVEVCKEHKVQCIDEIAYGKGFGATLPYWQRVISGLSALRETKGMAPILTAHCKKERFESVDTESYDRYCPRLHRNASDLFGQWADEILFCCYKVYTKNLDEGFDRKRTQAIGGERIIRTTEKPFCLAKNRLGLSEEMPLNYGKYIETIENIERKNHDN